MTKRLVVLALFLVVCALLFMTVGAKGNWDFILMFRGSKLLSLIVVALAVSTSTLLFQTVSGNQIIAPSIMGFDALYVLLLTCAVYFLGGATFSVLPEMTVFAVTMAVMIVASLALFSTLLGAAQNDVMRLILTGVIFATLFRSITSFFQRIIDPNEYAVIAANSYARFNRIETDLLWIAMAVLVATVVVVWRMRHRLDVISLGYAQAVNLGEDPRRATFWILCLIAIFVSVSTALVGPVVFLGLIVVSVARLVTPTPHHSVLLISSALVGAITLFGGQLLMERVFALTTPLSVVIDFVGGCVFLIFLLKGIRR